MSKRQLRFLPQQKKQIIQRLKYYQAIHEGCVGGLTEDCEDSIRSCYINHIEEVEERLDRLYETFKAIDYLQSDTLLPYELYPMPLVIY